MRSLLGKHHRRPDITFHKSGRIDITSRVARAIGLAGGDVLDVVYDKGEYYLCVCLKAADATGRHEAQCWPTKKGSHNFRAHSKCLCEAVMRLSNATDAARLPIGDRALLYNKTTPAVVLIARNNLDV